MPTYLLSVFGPTERSKFGNYQSREEMLAAFADTGAFNEMLQREGHFVYANGLDAATTATTVDARGQDAVVTDGPYLRTPEQIGGFWVIEAADLDQAIALAKEGSRACRGVVEVRPFHTEESIAALMED